MSNAQKGGPDDGHHHGEVAVNIITPSGIFPSDDTLQRAPEDKSVETVLAQAQAALKITDTKDWIVRVDERHINPHETFKHLGLRCIVDIDWHPREGGGGA